MIETTRQLLRPSRPAFTLIEVLIASGLVAVVLGLALTGFTEAKKIADLTRSKVTAADEASLGIEKMAKIIRRCHIVFFDARPIPNHADQATARAFYNGLQDNATGESLVDLGALTNIPGTLRTEPDARGITLRWVPGTGSFPNGSNAVTARRDDFRFMTGTVDGRRLESADTTIPVQAGFDPQLPQTTDRSMDKYFPSPLFYGAEATFNNSNTGAGNTQVDPSLPMTWTFYVMYLAPMTFNTTRDVGHALFPLNAAGNGLNQQRDLGRADDGTTYRRTTMPYEIRLLTIPDVLAIEQASSDGGANTETQKFGRLLRDDGDTTQVIDMPVRPFPHDAAPGTVNFDPQPFPMDDVLDLSRNINEFNPQAGSGARVNGRRHGNFRNLGNDPPSAAALLAAERREWLGIANPAAPAAAWAAAGRPITDTVIARYIDPDAPNGTCVRLAVDERWRGINHLDRPYVNAYGGPQRLRHRLLEYDATGAKTGNLEAGELSSPPKRCYISVATRFRSTANIPFQFSTESIEVDLEALARYQAHDRSQD